jgi:chromosomal replication initiator protein
MAGPARRRLSGLRIACANGVRLALGIQEVTRDDTEIVSALQLALADRVGQERFQLWFGAHTRLDYDDESLTVSVPNQFFQEWLRTNFRQQIEASCEEALGKTVPVRFSIDDKLVARPCGTRQEHQAADASSVLADGPARAANDSGLLAAAMNTAAPAGAVAATIGPPVGSASRRRFANLQSFVVGDSNRIASVAARGVIERPGVSSPLVLHGPTSVGKTHLLEGLWTEVRRARTAAQAVYLSSEQFTTYFLEALHGSGLPNFRRKYRGVDLLMIDDLQFFAGKKATLTELLYTIDTFHREGRQLIFAADRPPDELAELGPEITTRLRSGLVCEIRPPEYEVRLGIARQLAERMALAMPEEVLVFLATRVATHGRELCGALNRLDAASRAWQEPITLALAEQALSESVRVQGKGPRLADIEQAVCEVFGLEPRSLQSDRKTKHVSHPRMLAMWLARKYTRAALSEIGHFFGGRSHSTVISAQRKVTDWMTCGSPLAVGDGECSIDEALRRVERELKTG